jgi:small subunit ribosomal protein S1
MVQAKVLDVDVEKERISLGIKQLRWRPDPFQSGDGIRKGSVVTGTSPK